MWFPCKLAPCMELFCFLGHTFTNFRWKTGCILLEIYACNISNTLYLYTWLKYTVLWTTNYLRNLDIMHIYEWSTCAHLKYVNIIYIRTFFKCVTLDASVITIHKYIVLQISLGNNKNEHISMYEVKMKIRVRIQCFKLYQHA